MFGNNRWILTLCCLVCVSLPTVDASEKMTVITYQEEPFAHQVKGVKQGMVIELIEKLFNQAGIDYEVIFYPLKRGMAMAKSHQNTCVLPIERSQQRESQYRWLGPVLLSRYGFYSKKALTTPLITLDDAKSYRIGSFLGSGVGEYLANYGYQVELANNDSLNLRKLARGRIELWAADVVTAKSIMNKEGINVGEPELVFFTSIRAMACHLSMDEARHKALSEALLVLYQSGYMTELNTKYGLK
ncbi:substrate-binding periplasmic protein [Shewanella aestuarii]|uniref:Transporter substrate-binding domain-containing protein n=1 Tax=Shewanella aestuarii TaxID=1028752 RepID=A0A6G9QJV1_9GAMM|nr:transporter substrate-binding domain-containing protein [Shewanella aestuarii]QIR14844.1 transporter substrate-binding domain-containing protein [Shewanella aestuarii]